MREFKNFLREFRADPPDDVNDQPDPNDPDDRDINEYLTELHKVLKNTPLIHNTPQGTYKFKSLYHALAGHASHGVHAAAMSVAPIHEISQLGHKMADGYVKFGDFMEPHVHRAVERVQQRLRNDNRFKSVPREELTSGIYGSFLEGSESHLKQVANRKYGDVMGRAFLPKELRFNVQPSIIHMVMNFPKIKKQVETHPYQFIFDGGHLGDLPEDQSDIHGRAANFFPKWNG